MMSQQQDLTQEEEEKFLTENRVCGTIDKDFWFVFDDEDPERLIRGNKIIDGTKIEWIS